MSLSPAAGYIKFGTEHMARLSTTQMLYSFLWAWRRFRTFNSKARESPRRKKQHSQHGECLKTRIQASVCVKNIIRYLFLHIGLNLKTKSRYCCECTLYSKEIVLHYWPIAIKVTSFIGNTRTVLKVDFQENASKGSRDIAVLLLCFPCKVLFFIG
jgi:hypothetical protein